jgi:hypothetical protein
VVAALDLALLEHEPFTAWVKQTMLKHLPRLPPSSRSAELVQFALEKILDEALETGQSAKVVAAQLQATGMPRTLCRYRFGLLTHELQGEWFDDLDFVGHAIDEVDEIVKTPSVELEKR